MQHEKSAGSTSGSISAACLNAIQGNTPGLALLFSCPLIAARASRINKLRGCDVGEAGNLLQHAEERPRLFQPLACHLDLGGGPFLYSQVVFEPLD